jgi:hypothetical protein
MRRSRQWASALLLLVIAVVDVAPVAAASPAADGGAWRWPAAGRVTQRYGCTGAWTNGRRGTCRHWHSGIDIANRLGTPIRAAHAGTVSYVGYNRYDPPGRRAWIVIISHGDGLKTWYAHMQPKRVRGALAGDRVQVGEVVGYMGATGFATGVHLHFGVELRGKMVNPKNYLAGWPAGAARKSRSGARVTTIDLPSTAVDDNPATAAAGTASLLLSGFSAADLAASVASARVEQAADATAVVLRHGPAVAPTSSLPRAFAY